MGAATGLASRKRKQRFTRTGGGSGASVESICCVSVGNWWNAVSLPCETGAMRRTHLRFHDNIIKRLLIHAGAFNLSLIMRKLSGCGTPRGLQGRIVARLFYRFRSLCLRSEES